MWIIIKPHFPGLCSLQDFLKQILGTLSSLLLQACTHTAKCGWRKTPARWLWSRWKFTSPFLKRMLQPGHHTTFPCPCSPGPLDEGSAPSPLPSLSSPHTYTSILPLNRWPELSTLLKSIKSGIREHLQDPEPPPPIALHLSQCTCPSVLCPCEAPPSCAP